MARLILLTLLFSISRIAMGESLVIEPKHASFDVITASSTVEQVYTVSNRGSEPVQLLQWKAISELGQVVDLPKSLLPGASAQFKVILPLPGKLGESTFRYALFTDEKDVERYRFTLSGFVFSALAPENATIDLGHIQAESKERHELTLTAREEKPLRLIQIVDTPDWIDASIDGATVSAGIQPGVSMGIKVGKIRISTNLASQPFVEIATKAFIEGNLKPSTYAVGFKPTEIGQTVHASIEVRYTGARKIGDLTLDAPAEWKAARSDCKLPATADVKCARFDLERKIEASGRISGFLQFRMPGEPELSIPFGLMGLNPGQPIRELLVSDDPQVSPSAKIDIAKAAQTEREKSALKPVVAPGAPTENKARTTGSGPVRLHWKTTNDASIYGYMIYRANDRAGPYIRISPKPLAKRSDAPTTDSAAENEFIDENVESGMTYYYYIDTVAGNGTQKRLSPVLSKTVTP